MYRTRNQRFKRINQQKRIQNQNRTLRNRQLNNTPLRRFPQRGRYNQNRNRNRNNTRNIPLYKPMNMKTNTKVINRTDDMFRLKIKLAVGPNCFTNTTYVIPLQPLFLNQQLLNHALNYTSFKINRVTIMTEPLVATTDDTSIAIGYTTHCTPITSVVNDQFSKITNLAGTHGMAHTPLSYTIPTNDPLFHPIVPVIPSDVPFTIFITSQTAGLNLLAKFLPYLVLDISFKTQYTGDEINNTLSSDLWTITTGNTGTQSSSVTPSTFGFVQYSTATNIDIGELIQLPAFPASATDYIFAWTHNNLNANPINDPGDRGNINANLKTLL